MMMYGEMTGKASRLTPGRAREVAIMTFETITTEPLLAMLSKVVRERRDELSLSQEELSQRSGLHRTYISDVERGSRNLSVKNLIRLAHALEMTPSALLRRIENSV